MLRDIPKLPATVSSIALSPDGHRVVFGSADGTVRLWDVDNDREIAPRPGHTFAVAAVALSKGGRRALSGGYDGTVRLWNLAGTSGERGVRTFGQRHSGAVRSVALSPDGKRVLSGSDDGTARVWDVPTGKVQGRFEQTGREVTRVTFSHDAKLALSFSPRGGRAVLWQVQNATTVVRRFVLEGNTFDATLMPDDKNVLVARNGGEIGIFPVEAGTKDSRSFPCVPAVNVVRLAASPDGRSFVSGSEDGTVRVWDLTSPAPEPVSLLGQEGKSITSVAYSPDGTMVAASRIDGRVIVWNPKSREKLREWKMPGTVHEITFDAKSSQLVTANGNGTVFFLRLRKP